MLDREVVLLTDAGELYLSPEGRATLDFDELDLTQLEFDVLAVLAEQPGEVVTLQEIQGGVSRLPGSSLSRSAMVGYAIRKLNGKFRRVGSRLGAVSLRELIVTINGHGYILQAYRSPFDDPIVTPREAEALGLEAEALGLAGSVSASMGPAEAEWRAQIGPLLTAEDLADWGGYGEGSVAVLVDLAVCLALPADGDHLYPAFQFDQAGRPYDVLREILPLFTEARIDPYTVAAWFTSSQPGLDASTPAEWLESDQDDAQLVRTARQAIARLSR